MDGFRTCLERLACGFVTSKKAHGALRVGLRSRRLACEVLEDRRLLSIAVPSDAHVRPKGAWSAGVPASDAALEDASLLGWQTIFSEDFEGAFPAGSWTVEGDPSWDDVSYTAHGGNWSAFCAGTTITPPDPYLDNMYARMIWGPFSLADATDAKMDFWYQNQSEADYDYFHWMASTDGVNFYGHQVTGDQGTWRSESFDLKNVPTLGNLCGESQVWIAFQFDSDYIYGDVGAFVDDIVISKYTGASQSSWVMAYYLSHGDNLDAYQAAKFSAIASGANNSNVKCLVLYDFLDTTHDAVFQVAPGLSSPSSYTRGVNMWWSSDIGLPAELNMGDDATLSTYMNWVVDHYAASDYGLALYDHGNGWKSSLALDAGPEAAPLGVCWDGGDYLTTAELGDAFAAIDSHRGADIEVTYVDACLMQMIEVAYEIGDHTDFIVSNENLGWSNSPSYEAGYLGSITSATTPLALATSIATSYHNWEAGRNLPHAVSVVDTAQMSNVYDAVQTLVDALLAAIATPVLPTDVNHFAEVRLARTNAQKFDENGNHVLDDGDAYVDLAHFAQRLQIDVIGSDATAVDLRAAAQALEAAMGSSYLRYSAQTSGTTVVNGVTYVYDLSNATGQSIYLPENAWAGWLDSYSEGVLAFCNGNWDEFLDAYLPADVTAPHAWWQSPPASEGDPFWIEFQIENRGSTNAGASYVRAYLSTDNDFDTSDDYALPVKQVSALSPGQSANLRWDFTMPDLGSGSYTVWMIAQVDYYGSVTEYYEDNTWKIFDGFAVQDLEGTAPQISGLPDLVVAEDGYLNNAIDLWAYTSDAETADSELLFEIVGNTAPDCGVSIDSNRYIDIDPTANWHGISDVTIRVTDPSMLSDTDSFRITVNSVNDAPVVGALADSPASVTPPATLTLTATGVGDPYDPAGYVTEVFFYRESNGQPGLQVGADTLVGTDEDPNGGWSAGVATLSLPKGTYTYYAQAEDNQGLKSADGTNAPATTNAVSPIVGDLTSDGFVGADDLDIIRAFWGESVPVGAWSQGDASGDGFVGADDLDILRSRWGEGVTRQPGDLNDDGFVGADDLDIIRAYWGQPVPMGDWSQGDPSGDGFVGADDLDILRAHWGEGTPVVPVIEAKGTVAAPLGTSTCAVPEETTQREAAASFSQGAGGAGKGTAPLSASAQVTGKGTVPFSQGENRDSSRVRENSGRRRVRENRGSSRIAQIATVDERILAQVARAYQQEQDRLRERWQRRGSRPRVTDLVLAGWRS